MNRANYPEEAQKGADDGVNEGEWYYHLERLTNFDDIQWVLSKYKDLKINPRIKLNIMKAILSENNSDADIFTLFYKLVVKDNTLVGALVHIHDSPEKLLKDLKLRELAQSYNGSTVESVKHIISILEQEPRYKGLYEQVFFV